MVSLIQKTDKRLFALAVVLSAALAAAVDQKLVPEQYAGVAVFVGQLLAFFTKSQKSV